jgi:UDP-N-acetyl-D-glucosamine dehydrogenase
LSQRGLADVDAVLICTDHDAVDYELLVEAALLVVDTRNVCARRGLLRSNAGWTAPDGIRCAKLAV